MNALFITGRLLLEIASAGFGVTLGFAVKNWLARLTPATPARSIPIVHPGYDCPALDHAAFRPIPIARPPRLSGGSVLTPD